MKAYQADYPITTMCRVLGVSTSGYYAWKKRVPSTREREDQMLTQKIRQIHTESHKTYGAPRVHAELKAKGWAVGRKRVARLMRLAGLRGVSRRKTTTTTRRDPDQRPAPDLVERNFSAEGPDRLWVADITYVLSALQMAIDQRQPHEVIHHSDQGSQYTALAFGTRCSDANVRPSMGSVGDCFDNALCESFFATLECELIDLYTFRDQHQARTAVLEFIEGWYNPHRRHSALEYLSPIDFERRAVVHSNYANFTSPNVSTFPG